MNLHGIVASVIGAVNPQVFATVQISAGYVIGADGKRVPGYQTPGAITAAITGNVLTVSGVTAGTLAVGQSLADLMSVLLPGTAISGLGSGSGGIGTYTVNLSQTVPSEPMTTSLLILAQVQALTTKDLRQLDWLNVQGSSHAIYMNGEVDAIVRVSRKGGDLITLADGTVWLTTQILEQWPNWVKCAATLQVS